MLSLLVHIVTAGLWRFIYKDPVRTGLQTNTASVIKTSQLMLYREIITVSSEIHTKHITTLCEQNVQLLNVKPGGTYSNRWALEGYI
jgi:hypothetical protein